MPQKKNPDLLEYLRGKTGSLYGNFFAMLTILKGLPLSYFKDLQDDKIIVFNNFDLLINCLKILDEVINNLSPNKKRMLELAQNGYITATDLADYLVKNHYGVMLVLHHLRYSFQAIQLLLLPQHMGNYLIRT